LKELPLMFELNLPQLFINICLGATVKFLKTTGLFFLTPTVIVISRGSPCSSDTDGSDWSVNVKQ